MKPDATVSNTNTITFASSSSEQKYGGILQKSAAKLFRKELSELVSFIYSVAPPFELVHRIVTFFRVLQLIGPSLFPGYLDFWKTDYISQKTLFIFSIFFYIIPPEVHDEASFPALLAYIIISGLAEIIFFASSKYFKKNANLPHSIPPSISFFISCFGFLLPPVAVELLASSFSQFVFSPEENKNVTRTIILLIISVILTVIYLYIFIMFGLQVLTFQPMSLITVCTMPQIIIISSGLIINLLVGFSEFANAKTTIGFCCINAVVYVGTAFTCVFKGGLVNPFDSKLLLGSCMTGFATSVVMAIFMALEKDATFIIIALFIAFEIVFYLISSFLYRKMVLNRLKTLDLIADEVEYFEHVKSVNHFINLTVTGFAELHPICLNWSLLKMGIEKWPKSGSVWFVYAKFVAVFPEETQTLAWIFRSVTVNKVKGIEARTVKGQSLSIARQREVNLSPDLKTKLNSCTKHVTNAKHRLRNVWDMSIQGNISDMEMATKRVIKVIKKCDGDLLHILRLFPNNRFVTRQYARFCKELLADYETCADMIEKSRLLQRNIKINKDQSHEYGLLAFPNLPEKLDVSNQMLVSPATTTEMTSSVIDIDETDNENQEREESSFFLNRIEKLRIPSTCGMTVISLILYIVLFAIPVIVILLIIPGFIDDLVQPLQYMNDISMARTIMYQIIGFGLQAFMELKGEFPEPNGTDRSVLPLNFGSTFKTYEQLSYLCKQMTLTMEKLDQFRSYKKANSHMDQAKAEIFQPTLNYTYYSKTNATFKMISITSALSDIVSQQRELITGNSVSDDFVNTSAILNPSTSMTSIADKFNSALSLMVQFITDNDNETEKLITYILIAAVVVSIIIFVVCAIAGERWVESNKQESFRCLTSLPKNEVSQLAENLRILKKETENSTATQTQNNETNKQEENILKMFMTGGTNGNSHDSFYIISLLMIIMVLQVISIVLLLITMKDISKNLRRNSPHLDYLQGMYANLVAATTCITSLIGFNNPNTTIFNINKEGLLERINLRLGTTRDYYNLARYGGSSIDDPPFAAYQEYIETVDDVFKCEDPLQLTTDFKQATLCYTADDLIILTEGVYRSYTIPYRCDEFGNYEFLPNNDKFRIIWDLLIYPVYDIFIFPMSSGIIQTISDDLDEIFKGKIIIIVILLVLGFIFEAIFLFIIFGIDSYIRGVLKLLLHCQPQVLAHSSKVMEVLNGNFKRNKGENGTRTTKFYQAVCEELPDPIIICDQQQIIQSTNRAASRIFTEKTINEVLNHPLSDFLSTSKFEGNVQSLLSIQPQKPATETLKFVSPETESIINIEASSMIINDGIVVILRDVTQTVRYNTLIKEERLKSDKLLGSILPASLVPRVQAGEKNISFAVQSATIVFMDIVSFTPWCGSLPAEKVMSTLNRLFMKDDNLVAKYSTMTKIKCIGDCYMAAGGIFSEVNQPAVHAKEVVNFGLDALDAISDLNKELNESLRIRVGINSGGPIVAGVLGVGKPTFEILGPAINMAQQMEHHGVPSQVHISRSVYELIYGDSYDIKERGQIEVKNGTVVTYLVNRKK
ncbi:hypothetical protein M9Y10_026666 [Tritrichomonas musculus]|uniref:Guanylate cyclase domain-containing protein n=1 Tax=Tritrichomonas musculus TaxID=1915356 RepID=A0ABR2H6D5_9EUKA